MCVGIVPLAGQVPCMVKVLMIWNKPKLFNIILIINSNFSYLYDTEMCVQGSGY